MVSYPNISKGEGLRRTFDLSECLIDDVYKSFETLEKDKTSQFLRRSCVRTVFSFIEGMIQIIKYDIREALILEKASVSLTKKETEVLFEEKQKNGEKIKIFIAADHNLKKTFSIAKKVWKLKSYTFCSDGVEYRDFLKAKGARDQLTHPRTYYDMEIMDDEMSSLASSYLWLISEFESLMNARIEEKLKNIPENERSRIKKEVYKYISIW